MSKYATLLATVCCVISLSVIADEDPAAGKLLVATDEVQGPTFKKTVILLIQYDETGAMGLVINQPGEISPNELLPDLKGLADYIGNVYWGGPVQLSSMRALYRAKSPPADAITVFDTVHRLPLDEGLPQGANNTDNLRFFIGYSGWAPGQLDREMAFGSWTILPATEDIVFAKDAGELWYQLAPPRHYRASVGHRIQTQSLNYHQINRKLQN